MVPAAAAAAAARRRRGGRGARKRSSGGEEQWRRRALGETRRASSLQPQRLRDVTGVAAPGSQTIPHVTKKKKKFIYSSGPLMTCMSFKTCRSRIRTDTGK